VGGFKAAEIPALHGAGETTTDGDAGHVDLLTFNEVRSENFVADIEQVLRIDAEFRDFALRLYLGFGEMSALGLAGVLGLLEARTQLHGRIAILVLGACSHDLASIQLQHGHRHVTPVLKEQARHAYFLRNYSGAHGAVPLELDLDVDARCQVELHQRVHGLGCRIDDVQEALMRPDFELFTAFLVNMRRAVDREAFDAVRQRNRSAYLRARTLRRIHDLLGGVVENTVVEGFEPDSDVLALHVFSPTVLTTGSLLT